MKEKIKTDVLVIGGGTSGVFAAIAAARCGARVLLAEKNSILGGTVTVAGVNFPGLFFAWGKQIIAGPCFEAIERTVKLGGAVMPEIQYRPEKHWYEQISLNKFIYTAVLFEMCRESGVGLLTNAMLASAEETADGISAELVGKSGKVYIDAKNIIDTSGDVNAAGLLGYAVEKSETLQPATLQNHISGYDMSRVDINEIRDKFNKEGFPAYITADMVINWLNMHKIDMHIPCGDATTSRGRGELEQRTYADMLRVYCFYRKIGGLGELCVDYAAAETGVRETNRIIGEHRVTADEYINGCLYKDAVCYAFYPIDLHVMEGIRKVYLKDGIVPCVPYGALIPKGGQHIICAGRCISSDTHANSALRVQATCRAAGQAAGCAAAIACRDDVKISEVDHVKLCRALENIGAIVPA